MPTIDREMASYHSCCYLAVVALVVTLVLLVKRGVHLPTLLRGFLFYIQIVPIAVAYFPSAFKPNTTAVSLTVSMAQLTS